MPDILVIEDDDGHRVEYAWPEGVSLLHAASFADLCLADFEQRYPETEEER